MGFVVPHAALAQITACVTPQQYGATSNGLVDDDTTAVSAALNSGQPVCLSGEFRITSEVVVTQPGSGAKKNIYIAGFGRQASKIYLDGSAAGVRLDIGTPNNYDTPQIVLKDFSLVPVQPIINNRYQAALALTASGGLSMTDPTFDVRNVDVRPNNPDAYAINGVFLNNMRIGTLDNLNILGRNGSYVQNTSGLVITGDNEPVEIAVRGVNAYWVGTGFNLVNQWQGVSISECAAIAVNDGVIANTAGASTPEFFLRVLNSHFNATRYGIYGRNISQSFISGNLIYLSDNGRPAAASEGIHLEVNAGFAMASSVTNNHIDGVARAGNSRIGIYFNGAATGSLGTIVDQNRFVSLDVGLSFDSNVRNVLRGNNTAFAVATPFASLAASGANQTVAAPTAL